MSSNVAAVLKLRTWSAMYLLRELTYLSEEGNEFAELIIMSGKIQAGTVAFTVADWSVIRPMLEARAESEGDQVGPAIRLLADAEQFGVWAEIAERELGDEEKRVALTCWLQSQDMNGCYDDEHSVAEGYPLMSLERAREIRRAWARDEEL